MIGTDPEETAQALEDHAEFAAAELLRATDASNRSLQARLDAVLALCAKADEEGVTGGGLFTVAAVRQAATEG